MRDEVILRQIITNDNYQAHLVEARIRQILKEGDKVKVVIIRKRGAK